MMNRERDLELGLPTQGSHQGSQNQQTSQHDQDPPLRHSFCQRLCQNPLYVVKSVIFRLGKYVFRGAILANTVSNANYAGSFSYTSIQPNVDVKQITFWSPPTNYSAVDKFLFYKNVIGTLAVSSSFVVRYFGVAVERIPKEWAKVRQGKNRPIFAAAIIFALLAAIPGAFISGGSYASVFLEIGASGLGLAWTFTSSTLGLLNLIPRLVNFIKENLLPRFFKDYAFRKKVVEYLHQVDPIHKNTINQMLQGVKLTEKNLVTFLQNLSDYAVRLQIEHKEEKTQTESVISRADEIKPLFKSKSAEEIRRERIKKGIELGTAATLTFFNSPAFIQSAFGGLTVLAKLGNSNFDTWSNAGKIAISLPFALPQMAFSLTNIKVSNHALVAKWPEIKKSPTEIAKAAGLVMMCEANATWFGGLMEHIFSNDNILPPILQTRAGVWSGYIASGLVGMEGLVPIVFPSPPPKELDMEHPELSDVIQCLEREKFSDMCLRGLRKNSIFADQGAEVVEGKPILLQPKTVTAPESKVGQRSVTFHLPPESVREPRGVVFHF